MAVIITGASRGLGFELARRFGSEGHHLILTARSRGTIEAAAEKIKKEFGSISVESYAIDLVNRDEIAGFLKWLKEKDVDTLINNAGIYPYKPFLVNNWEEIETTVTLNLTSVMLLTHGVIPLMLHRGGGKLIHIASDVSKRAIANMAPYVASKFGLLGFSKSIASEFRSQGITSTAILPGIINSSGSTEPGIERGMLSPKKIADVVYFAWENSGSINFDEIEFHPVGQDY